MRPESESNLALFIDFDNVALGARDARQRFDIDLVLQRLLEKGKIIIKKAYADWHYYKEHMGSLHEAAIELIEIPKPRISGKNSADIRLVVDAMDLCYAKHHINTFVIVSGDSDFSPLVSKLRENNKRVIGIGVKNSSSSLLISNCDEFIFYDDIYRGAMAKLSQTVADVPKEKRELFDFVISTTQRLLQESRGVLYSSLIKDTMKRKRPDFNEANFGYSTFGELLEDLMKHGLLVVDRDARAGGTWVVQALGKSVSSPSGRPPSRSRRSTRRRGRRGRGSETTPAADPAADGERSKEAEPDGSEPASEKAAAAAPPSAAKRRPMPAAERSSGAQDTGGRAEGETPTQAKSARAAGSTGSEPRSESAAAAKPAATKTGATGKKTRKKTKKATRKPVRKSTKTDAGPAKKRARKKATKKTATTKKAASKAATGSAGTAKATTDTKPAKKKTAKKKTGKTAKKTVKKATGKSGANATKKAGKKAAKKTPKSAAKK